MDILANIMPSEHSLWFVGAFWVAMGIALAAGALVGHGLRRVPVMMHFGVRMLLTVVGMGAAVFFAVPAIAALSAVAIVPAVCLGTFTIALVCSLGDQANIWDDSQEKWVVSLSK